MILFGIKPVDVKGYRATKRRQFTFYTDFSKILGAHMKVFLIKKKCNVVLLSKKHEKITFLHGLNFVFTP